MSALDQVERSEGPNQHPCCLRVRYSETDAMGYVYHGNYAVYYHMARTEYLREFGINEKQLEKDGIILPVIGLNQRFLKPARFDELLTIETRLEQLTPVRMQFRFRIWNETGMLINEANSTVVFVNGSTRKPMRVPKAIQDKLVVSEVLVP